MITNFRVKKIEDNPLISHLELFTLNIDERKYNLCFAVNWKDDAIAEQGHFKGALEFIINRTKSFIKLNSIAIDIGAYNGDTTIPMACLVGNGKVIAFEPGLEFQYGLNINCGLNPFLNIDAHNLAVMEETKIYEFLYSDKHENGGPKLNTDRIINPDGKKGYPIKRLVRGVNLFDFLGNKIHYKDISYIKLDTEGYDMHILNSIAEIIYFIRPVVQVEWFYNTTNNIIRFLKTYNYHSMDFKDSKEYKWLPEKWTDDLILIPN